jgi:hypothetical protein
MTITQSVENEAKAVPGATAHLARSVESIAACAAALRKPAFQAFAFSAGAAGLLWLVWLAPYAFDSLRSALACFAALILLSLPAALLFWLQRALRRIAELPERVTELDALDPQHIQNLLKAGEPAAGPRERLAWRRALRWGVARINVFLDLRAQIQTCRQTLSDLLGAAGLAALLANPLTAIAAATAVGLSALVAIAALVAITWRVVAAML